jgi:hypothetical protein
MRLTPEAATASARCPHPGSVSSRLRNGSLLGLLLLQVLEV